MSALTISEEEERSTPPSLSHDERVRYLRERGVEVDLVYDKSGEKRPPRETFKFVGIPVKGEIYEEEAERDVGDALKSYLGPRFSSDDASLDDDAVEREAMGRIQSMMVQGPATRPSTETIKKLASTAGAEVYPLLRGGSKTSSVNLYLDEVGALRQRPRNPRAEKLAAELAGLPGLTIHGDVYVGRVAVVDGKLRNENFYTTELDPQAQWAKDAKANHAKAYDAAADSSSSSLKRGSYENYSWTQNVDDVEITVPVPPEFLRLGPLKTKRVSLTFPRGGLHLAVDNLPLLVFPKLFDKISIDDASWSLDDGDEKTGGKKIVISLEKSDPREWAVLHLDEQPSSAKKKGIDL